MHALTSTTLQTAEKPLLSADQGSLLTVQGGIGTFEEDQFLQKYYNVDGTGWATPFLLVPEVTVLDDETRALLAKSKENDTYTSGMSPLGVPFNAVKGTASEAQKLERAYEQKRPGSPCPKGYLISNTKYSKRPVCTAATFFQKREVAELDQDKSAMSEAEYDAAYAKIIDKACLCEDLAASALIVNKIPSKRPLKTAICAGPNIAYFTKLSSLKEMVSHVYGRLNVLSNPESRPQHVC